MPESLATTSGALVGAALAAGADLSPDAGTAVGAAVAPVSLVGGTGVAVAEEPQAIIATNRIAKGPKTISLGCFIQ